MRQFPVLFAALLTSVLTSACAAGDGISQPATSSSGDGGGDGDGGGNDEGGGSGDGGRSSNHGAGGDQGPGPGSPSSSSSSSSDGGGGPGSPASSSSGIACSEDPCKLVSPQCGCGVDEKCSLDGTGERLCVEDGTQTQGQECGDSFGDCEAGALCVYVFGTDNAISSCSRFCESDAECQGQGGLCSLGLSGVDDVKLCSDNCDLVSGSGCAIAGTKCDFGYDDAAVPARYFTVCGGDNGVGTQFEPCDQAVGCSAGNICLETQTAGEFVCFQWCSSAAPSCPDALECFTDFEEPLQVGNVTYGICQGAA